MSLVTHVTQSISPTLSDPPDDDTTQGNAGSSVPPFSSADSCYNNVTVLYTMIRSVLLKSVDVGSLVSSPSADVLLSPKRG